MPAHEETSPWAQTPFKSKVCLQMVIKNLWPNSIPTDDKVKSNRLRILLINGFLRIHMEAERQPFETFLPRFYAEDPKTWEDTLIQWREHCKPTPGQGATDQHKPTSGKGATE